MYVGNLGPEKHCARVSIVEILIERPITCHIFTWIFPDIKSDFDENIIMFVDFSSTTPIPYLLLSNQFHYTHKTQFHNFSA